MLFIVRKYSPTVPYACTADDNGRFGSMVAQAPSQSDQYSLDRFGLCSTSRRPALPNKLL